MVAVWRCVSLLAGGVSGLPSGVWAETPTGRRVPLDTPAWLAKPLPWQAPVDFWHRVMVSLLMDGNAFIWTQRNDRGRIVALHVLDPKRVTIEERESKSDIRFQIDGEYFDRSWILWIPNFTVDWQLRGLSPIDAARQAIDLGLTVEEFGSRFFHQGTSMAGVIQHPGTPEKDEAEMLRDMFKKKNSGISNSHAIGILTGGASWQNITITPEQAQFLDTRRFQKSEIALLFGVPPHMVDPTVSSSWGSGVEEMNRFFTTFSLQDYITRIEQYVTLFLLPGKQFFKFNVDARLRPNTKERYAAYKTAIETGFMNRDEVRDLEDKEPIPNGLGKTFYRPLNFAPLGVGPYEGGDPNGDGKVDPTKDELGRDPEDPDYGKPAPKEDKTQTNDSQD
jgi:HK97 family phage portal protein